MDLFDDLPPAPDEARTEVAPGAVLLRGLARADDAALLQALDTVLAQSPPQHLQTPGGYTMSVLTTSCGRLGWVSDWHGYRYARHSPHTGQAWPAMPACFALLAQDAATQAGYPGFVPDACLINTYGPGAKMSLHQDKDERDLHAPIVSVSLGLPACSSSAACSATPPRSACAWRTATCWCGAALRAWPSTACCRWPTARMRCWGAGA